MVDRVDPAKRSWNMARIGSRDTSPELAVRGLLRRSGVHFRFHPTGLPGKPDLVLPHHRIAVFVNGCFWHGHRCGSRWDHVSKSNVIFWKTKISATVKRDKRAAARLRRAGWVPRVIWECQLERGLDRLIRTAIRLGGGAPSGRSEK